MEELILKMHEESMELEQTVTELRCIIGEVEDAISRQEVEAAENNWHNRRDVEKAEIRCSEIKRIIGMRPGVCAAADRILKEREEQKQKEFEEELKNEE